MCLGYPAQVVGLDPGAASATVDDRGRRRRASTLLADRVEVGDWVLVAAGNVIRRLDPDDAAGLAAELARAESLARDRAYPTSMNRLDARPDDDRPQGDTP